MTINKQDPNTDTKLPKKPSIFQRGNHDYPFIGGPGAGHWGEYDIVTHPDSKNADQSTAATEKLDIHDGYEVKEKTKEGKSVTHTLNPGHHFDYKAGGHSHNKDGHSDDATGGNENKNIGLDRGSSTANNGYDGHGGSVMSGTGGSGGFENHTGGTKYVTTKGDVVTQHDGNVHTNNKGDVVSALTGNKYDAVKGEYGVHVQGGNFDLRIEGGKGQIYSGSDLTITSKSKVTVNVGDSSFVIDGSSIKVKTSQFSVESDSFKVSSGSVEFSKK